MHVRRATDDDWPALWPVWRDVMAAGDSYPFAPGSDETVAREHWMPAPPTETWVATSDDGAVVGTYLVGPNKPGLGAHMATASFLVAPAAQGKGVGRALGEHCLDRARELGFRAMQFNAVVETNEAAVALWESLGFSIVGTVPEAHAHPVHGLVGIHIMHRKL